MQRPYVNFKEKRLGKRVDYDKAYGYQCVDLIKQYADECLGMGKIGAIGNAKEVPSKAFGQKFKKLSTQEGTVMQGDIIVRTEGVYGHIAIVDRIIGNSVYVLEQNGSGVNSGSGTGQNAIRIKEYKLNWFQIILRNDSIVANFNLEKSYVDEKIDERQRVLDNTIDYRNSLQLS